MCFVIAGTDIAGAFDTVLHHAGGLLPQCQLCQENNIQCCCHCVPAMPVDPDPVCNVCNTAPWDDADPLQQNWVTQHGCALVSLASEQERICNKHNKRILKQQTIEGGAVYHRKCSDRRVFSFPAVGLFAKPLHCALTFWRAMQKLQRAAVLSG